MGFNSGLKGLILMWAFDAEGQNSRHLGCDLSRMMGYLFCSCIGLSHVFLSSVLLMPLSSFCHVPLICSIIIFHFHVIFATPLSYYLFHFRLSVFPSSLNGVQVILAELLDISRPQFHLLLLGALMSSWMWRHLATKVGTSKGGGKVIATYP
jgi:hypothetical protein